MSKTPTQDITTYFLSHAETGLGAAQTPLEAMVEQTPSLVIIDNAKYQEQSMYLDRMMQNEESRRALQTLSSYFPAFSSDLSALERDRASQNPQYDEQCVRLGQKLFAALHIYADTINRIKVDSDLAERLPDIHALGEVSKHISQDIYGKEHRVRDMLRGVGFDMKAITPQGIFQQNNLQVKEFLNIFPHLDNTEKLISMRKATDKLKEISKEFLRPEQEKTNTELSKYLREPLNDREQRIAKVIKENIPHEFSKEDRKTLKEMLPKEVQKIIDQTAHFKPITSLNAPSGIPESARTVVQRPPTVRRNVSKIEEMYMLLWAVSTQKNQPNLKQFLNLFKNDLKKQEPDIPALISQYDKNKELAKEALGKPSPHIFKEQELSQNKMAWEEASDRGLRVALAKEKYPGRAEEAALEQEKFERARLMKPDKDEKEIEKDAKLAKWFSPVKDEDIQKLGKELNESQKKVETAKEKYKDKAEDAAELQEKHEKERIFKKLREDGQELEPLKKGEEKPEKEKSPEWFKPVKDEDLKKSKDEKEPEVHCQVIQTLSGGVCALAYQDNKDGGPKEVLSAVVALPDGSVVGGGGNISGNAKGMGQAIHEGLDAVTDKKDTFIQINDLSEQQIIVLHDTLEESLDHNNLTDKDKDGIWESFGYEPSGALGPDRSDKVYTDIDRDGIPETAYGVELKPNVPYIDEPDDERSL